MSDWTSFNQIKKFCKDKSLSKLHERILFHKYNEDLKELIDNYKTSENKEPSQERIIGFESSLLSSNTLSTNVKLADEEIGEYMKDEIERIEKNYSAKTFWMSVLASIIASIVFTILLVVIITIAQNQIKSWVDGLYTDQAYIHQKVNSNINNKN